MIILVVWWSSLCTQHCTICRQMQGLKNQPYVKPYRLYLIL